MSVESLSIHTITVQRNEATFDGKGGMPDSWTDKYTAVACRIQPRSASERAKWGGVPTMATHVIYVPDATLDILEDDRIVFGERTFNVVGSLNMDEWDRFLTVDVEEIRE